MDYLFQEARTPAGLTGQQVRKQLEAYLNRYKRLGRVLILPPDITRSNSYAGPIVRMLCELLSQAKIDIMPALGTHTPMSNQELDRMYPGVPHEWFCVHDWRNDVIRVGEVPGAFVEEVSGGWMDTPIPMEVNRRLLDPGYDLILSVGQVVPHEVVGMSNYNKNVFVGCGGAGTIHQSHFLGALYGMERMMGRDLTPVHRVFDYAEEHFIQGLPLAYILTVTAPNNDGISLRSLAVGRDRAMFSDSIRVSQRYNINFLEQPLKKVVVYLDPEEFRTTWLGNKAVYRTRMAIADEGNLLILAPGVTRFGEDLENDAVIRKYGYCGRKTALRLARTDRVLSENLSVAAHLVHGSSDGRFTITYAPSALTRAEIEGVGYQYADLAQMMQQYDIRRMKPGSNLIDGEEVYYIANPALGLWADRSKFLNQANIQVR